MSLEDDEPLPAVPSSPVEQAPHEAAAAVDEAPRLDLVLPDSPLEMAIPAAQEAGSATAFDEDDQVSVYDLPNPYDHMVPTAGPPPPPVQLLTPAVSGTTGEQAQQQPRRLPSVLRPGHLRSLSSVHSRSVSMAFLGDFPYGLQEPNPARFATSETDFRHSFASDGDQYDDRFYSWEEPPGKENTSNMLKWVAL